MCIRDRYTDDFVSLGKKFKFQNKKQKTFSREYRNEALGQRIILRSTNEKMQLIVEGTSIALNQVRDNEFMPQTNHEVKYVKLQRDEQQNIIGVYLTDGQIKNLYYQSINE